jgi:DNA modification methylase
MVEQEEISPAGRDCKGDCTMSSNEVNTSAGIDSGTSIFDPVLCEIMYLWFSACGDAVLDPFAGGSVRGIVASRLGRRYTGVELRDEQVAANVAQGAEICTDCIPVWKCGDSMEMEKHVGEAVFDFILTCPPYGDLEVYSDRPNDLSNMESGAFDAAYKAILAKAVARLAQNRFAVVVVGNYRDKNGYLRDLVGITVQAMEQAGARYYNDFIYVTPSGSLPIRTGKVFSASRKFGRTHQYALVFIKGDPKKATERIGEVVMPDLTDEETEE